jgi:hypothetical protein
MSLIIGQSVAAADAVLSMTDDWLEYSFYTPPTTTPTNGANYFDENTQVLTMDAITTEFVYTQIRDLKKGNIVLDIDGRPVVVTRVARAVLPFIAVRCENWYSDIVCSPGTRFYTGKKCSETGMVVTQYCVVEALEPGTMLAGHIDTNAVSMPRDLVLRLPSGSYPANYAMGHLFGLFAMMGDLRACQIIYALKGGGADLKTIRRDVSQAFPGLGWSVFDAPGYVVITAPELVPIFDRFDSLPARTFPHELRCFGNPEYARGVLDGLMCGSGSGSERFEMGSAGETVYQTLVWCCGILGRTMRLVDPEILEISTSSSELEPIQYSKVLKVVGSSGLIDRLYGLELENGNKTYLISGGVVAQAVS